MPPGPPLTSSDLPHRAADELFLRHPVPLWVYDRVTLAFLAVNDAAVQQYGYSRDEFLGMRVLDLRIDIDPAEVRAMVSNPGRRRHWRQTGVVRHRRRDGAIIHAEITSHDLTFEGRPAVAMAAYDVTCRLAAENSAREAERRLNEAQHLAQLGSWQWHIDTDSVTWSEELYRIFGLDRRRTAPPFAQQSGLYRPGDWLRLKAAVDKTVRTGDPYELVVQVVRPDDSFRWIISRGAAIRDTSGRIVSLHGTAHDITERCEQDAALRAAHERARESEDRYRQLVENIDDVVFSIDANGVIQYTSPSVEQFGYRPTELVGRPFLSIVHPDDRDAAVKSFAETLAGNRKKREFHVLDKEGRTRFVRSSNRVQVRDGVPVSVTGVLIDLTDQVRAQEHLRTAGRLEAVGRLAGGVAHDFNNLLVAINGFAELALGTLPGGSPVREDLGEILKAGRRAAALTSQLLAFSRRQVLKPDSISLNDVIGSMEPMLRRLIGEDIEIVIDCTPSLRHVRIDPGHLEQVIMNLVVNARDAMPDGGMVRIRTSHSDFPPDELPETLVGRDLAVITVSDTGRGMDDAIQAQIFEPFFTTKPAGQGTGLGLAMVYGFVKQSGGAIAVRSTPGRGATFHIALPDDQLEAADAGPGQPDVQNGSETILVTEDEHTVRMLVERILQNAGYHVLTADSGEQALRICRNHDGPIHLLLTDVVMPKMSGTVLAERATQLRPDMGVLFMSGYSGSDISARGLSDGTTALLQKPFSAGTLSEAVRSALAC